MTAKEHAVRLRALYAPLAEMDEFNLAHRIRYEAIGKSDPVALAAKIKKGGSPAPSAPLDEQAWLLAAQAVQPAAPKSPKDE